MVAVFNKESVLALQGEFSTNRDLLIIQGESQNFLSLCTCYKL